MQYLSSEKEIFCSPLSLGTSVFEFSRTKAMGTSSDEENESACFIYSAILLIIIKLPKGVFSGRYLEREL